jgi:hypothetical protein
MQLPLPVDTAASYAHHGSGAVKGATVRLRLDALVPADAGVMNAQWKYQRGDETRLMIAEGIAARPGACIRIHDDDDDDGGGGDGGIPARRQLIAWILMRPDGSLGCVI